MNYNTNIFLIYYEIILILFLFFVWNFNNIIISKKIKLIKYIKMSEKKGEFYVSIVNKKI